MRIKRVIAASAGVFAIAAAGVAVAPAAASAGGPTSGGTYLGPVNMQDACTNQYPEQGRVAAVGDPHNAFSWICIYPSWDLPYGGISVDKQCVVQYGIGARSGLRDRKDPASWYCQR
jgi:hypothetical protein